MQSDELRKTWLEVGLNGAWSGGTNENFPKKVSEIVEQGIACVKAGASIIQVCAYDESDGAPNFNVETYARIIDGIRSKEDAIIYPVVPYANATTSVQNRFAFIEELAQRNMLEWMQLDPGSINVAHYDDLRGDREGFVDLNPEKHVRHGLRISRNSRLYPSYGIYGPEYIRLGATMHWREGTFPPIYRLIFSRGFSVSFPPEDYGLTAYLNLLDQVAPGAPWMISGFDADILSMIPRTVMEGGHVRVGLADAALDSKDSNLQLVEKAQNSIVSAGGEIAEAHHVRAMVKPFDSEQ